MLMLLFYVGEERYACLCDTIVEIIPQVPLKKMAQAPEYFPGFLNYGGVPVPVVDFSLLSAGRPSAPYLSTRIILFRRQLEGGSEETLGMMAERVTDTIDRELSDFVDSGFTLRGARYMGGVLNDDHGLIHHLLIDQLFDAVHKLFATT